MADFFPQLCKLQNLGGLGDCDAELLVSGNYLSVRNVVLTVITVLEV